MVYRRVFNGRLARSRDGRGRLRERTGQAMAEMAIVLPILILLVFGIIEFGVAFRSHQIITNSAREGARVAVLPSTTNQNEEQATQTVETVVRDRMTNSGLSDDKAEVLFSCNGDGDSVCTGSGQETEVRVHYCHRFLVLAPLIAVAGASGDCGEFGEVELRTASTMRTE